MDQLTDYEMMIANHIVDPKDIRVSWENIAGLEHVIQELKETVILPIQRKELFEDSQLTQAPKVENYTLLENLYITVYILILGCTIAWSTRLW